MRLTRLHVDAALVVGARLTLPEAASNHLLRVLRLGEGDACVLFNGDGADYDARLVAVGKRSAEAEILARRPLSNESPLRLTLAQGMARGDKMDWILQKATELGVVAVVPIASERTEVKLDAERGGKRLQHWRGVVASACEQSGRAVLPLVHEPLALARYAGSENAGLKLALDPDGECSLESLKPDCGDDIALVVGPEGGLSERDLATLRTAGFRGLRLGPRVLRTETAGVAALAALQALYGDWRGN